MGDRQTIRSFSGYILGTIETDSQGRKTARNFYGKILGRYNPVDNYTRDFYGMIVSQGDTTAALIMQNNNDGQGR